MEIEQAVAEEETEQPPAEVGMLPVTAEVGTYVVSEVGKLQVAAY